jgi:hypothetical protein
MSRVKHATRRFIAFLASTVFLLGIIAGPALSITRNKAEGLANAQTEKDCNGRVPAFNPWACTHLDVSECHGTNAEHSLVPQWWCTEVFIQKRKLRKGEHICHRDLAYNNYGRLLTEYVHKIQCQPVDPNTA